MILIITHREDYTVDFIVNQLNQKSIPYFRLNCEDIGNYDYTINGSNNFEPSFNSMSGFSSVWYRRTKSPDVEGLAEPYKSYIEDELLHMIKCLNGITTDDWVSSPEKIDRAENKLYQLKTANRLGLLIPETIVTNNKNELKLFFKNNNENIIVKPFYRNQILHHNTKKLIFTNILTKEKIDNINHYDLTPAIYQRNIEKQYEVRVTIVNNDVFAASVNSQVDSETKNDWRRKQLPFYRYSLPRYIEDKCRDLVSELGLKFGAIDIIKAKDGEYYFLEINPNGQWAWIEMDTKLPISNSLIKTLTK